jgi:pimeloyl-[acyl-carrier protein] synthase
LRSEDPVHWSSTLGVWVLTRYVDVHAALRDSRFSCMAGRWEQYQKFFLRGGSATSPMAERYKRWMLQVDPPDHTRLRGLVNKAFTPRVVEKMRPAVQRSVDELVNRVVASGRMDVMSDLAFPLPIMVICDLLGVPREDNDKIREWTAALLPSLSPAISAAGVERVNAVIVEYREYFRELARQRRAEPKDDMLSALIAAEENDQKLTEEELLATCILLAFAGHATTAQLTGRAMHFLLQHPDQRQKLMDDPSLIVNAIEEVCRYDSMLQLIYRTTKEPVTIGDKTIPANQMVFLSLAGANRDPLQFPDPDRFDITRDAGKHIAFAYGIHYCVGAPLARLEGQIAVNTMLRRLPDLKLNQAGIRREPSLLLRGLTALPVTFGSDSN